MSRTNRYFYQVGQIVYYISDSDDELYEQNIKDKMEDSKTGFNYFESFKGYEPTHQSLIDYKNDFNNWNQEIKSVPKCTVDYTKYYNNESAVIMTFKSKASRQINELNLAPIKYKEFSYFEKCNNGGLMSFDEKFKYKPTQTYGYDYSSFYPFKLADKGFYIPTKEGKLKHITELDFDNLQYGIYKVKITANALFRKVFVYSPNNYYTHYSLLFAYEHKDKFNVEFELITEGEHNCLIYCESSLVESTKIFKKWYDYLMNLKLKFPKNKLIKHLLSSLWGSLIKFNRELYEDDVYELDISEFYDDDETEYKLLNEKRYKDDNYKNGVRILYEIIKSSNPYKNNLARLKPFFVSYCRRDVGDLIISENLVDNVIRIHTDGIALDKEHDFTHLFYYPKPEEKTTGNITWLNVNSYDKV
jgi:hypothetical protein